MFKTLISISLLFLSLSHAMAKVEVRWFSVAALVLEDESTQIFFDPMFTRAGASHWLRISKLKSDEPLVLSVLKDNDLSRVTALFASHSHYDHVIDAPTIAKLTGATFYVDESSERVAKAYKDPQIHTKRFQNLEKIHIGKFTITPIRRKHSSIRLIDMDWLPGPVPEDFDFGFYDYHVGDTWFYYIEHPDGNILIDQGSEPYLKDIKPFTSKVDVLIQGIANRKDDETVINGYVKELKPAIFIPTHFDNFFFGFHPKEEISFLPGVKMESMMEKMKKAYPQMNVVMPEYGKKVEILKGPKAL